jgi:hypothetical protein
LLPGSCFKYVPQHSRIIFVAMASFVHKGWLSWLSNRKRGSSKQPRPQPNPQSHIDLETATASGGGGGLGNGIRGIITGISAPWWLGGAHSILEMPLLLLEESRNWGTASNADSVSSTIALATALCYHTRENGSGILRPPTPPEFPFQPLALPSQALSSLSSNADAALMHVPLAPVSGATITVAPSALPTARPGKAMIAIAEGRVLPRAILSERTTVPVVVRPD